MSANIYIDEFKRASFFTAREKAWHGLGTVVDNALTSEEALKAARLDYTVDLAENVGVIMQEVTREEALELPVVTKIKDEGGKSRFYRSVRNPTSRTIYRTDTGVALGTVGKRYTVVQNFEAFEFFDSIVGKKEAMYETAGALGNGEVVFITAKLPNYIHLNDSPVELYLFIRLNHDGKGSIIGGLTPVRVVCNNTLNLALQNMTNEIRIRHTASANDKLKEAGKLMGLVNTNVPVIEEGLKYMVSKSVVDADVKNFFRKLYYSQEEFAEKTFESVQKNNVVDGMAKFYYSGIGQDEIRGTRYGLYNAVSGYFQNVKTSSNTQKMLESTVFGDNAKKVKKSFDLLTQEDWYYA